MPRGASFHHVEVFVKALSVADRKRDVAGFGRGGFEARAARKQASRASAEERDRVY